jgi:hypothetical protein
MCPRHDLLDKQGASPPHEGPTHRLARPCIHKNDSPREAGDPGKPSQPHWAHRTFALRVMALAVSSASLPAKKMWIS